MDLFDFKPELQKRHGQTANLEQPSPRRLGWQAARLEAHFQTARQVGAVVLGRPAASATQMDKLAVIKSLYSDSFAHGSAMFREQRRIIQGYPSWFVAKLRAGLAESEPARLCGDARPARRPHQRRSELVERLHAGGLSGHSIRAAASPILNLDSASG